MEGFSIDRPWLFMGKDYCYWKIKMTWFLKSIDYDLWEAIQNGYDIPIKFENGMAFLKSSHGWHGLEKRNAQPNAKLYFIFIVQWIEMNIIGSLNVKWQNIFEDF